MLMDMAKGIGISLVVLGHTQSSFGAYIYMFHMPLFFFISGYFFKDSYCYDMRRFFFKRMRSLYVPFVGYGILFFLFHDIFYRAGFYRADISSSIGGAISVLLMQEVDPLLAPFWFLPILFLVEIVFLLIHRMGRNRPFIEMVIFISSFGLGNWFTKFHILQLGTPYSPDMLNLVMVAVCVFYFGYKFREFEAKISLENIYLFTISALLLFFLHRGYGAIDMRVNLYPDPAFLLLGMFSGIYGVLFICNKIEKTQNRMVKYVSEGLCFAGINTIIVLALHYLCFRLVNWLQIIMYNGDMQQLSVTSGAVILPLLPKNIWALVYWVVGMGLPLILAYSQQKGMGRITHLVTSRILNKQK